MSCKFNSHLLHASSEVGEEVQITYLNICYWLICFKTVSNTRFLLKMRKLVHALFLLTLLPSIPKFLNSVPYFITQLPIKPMASLCCTLPCIIRDTSHYN